MGIKTKAVGSGSELSLTELLLRLSVLNEASRRVSLTVNERQEFCIAIPNKNSIGFTHFTIESTDVTKSTDQLYNEIMEKV